MESFYGGRQGASFVIKKSFKYLDPYDPAYLADNDFVSCYKDSRGQYVFTNLDGETTSDMPNRWDIMSVCLEDTGYQDVWYNEYCIINTTNKNNPNNGKIFRRVLPNEDYVTPGYEHIGTIVGPSSGAAMLKPQSGLLKLGDIREELAEDNWDGLGIDVDGKPVIYDPSFTSEDNIAKSMWPEGIEPNTYKVEIEKGLVHAIDPTDKTIVTKETVIEDGKTKIKTSYNSDKIVNDIKYNWFNVRKNTENNDDVVESWCYIGFEIPAPSFTVEALYKTPGTKPEVSLTDNANDFAFWHDIHFDIPGGIRGISVEKIYTNDNKDIWNLQETEELEGEQITPKKAWTFDQIQYDVKTDTYSIEGETISYNENEASVITTNNQKEYKTKAWFCDLCIINPKDSAEGDEWPVVLKNLRFFLGYIEEIEHVDLNTDTGHLVFKYHNEDEDAYDLRYPIDVNMDPYTGHVKVDYSLLEEDGLTHTKEEWDFRYPIDIDMDTDTGRVITTYSCANDLGPEEEIKDFRYPIDVYMDTKTGEVTTTYSLIDRAEDGEPVLDENGQYIHKTETEYFRYPIDVSWDVVKGDLGVKYSYANPDVEEEKELHEWEIVYPKTIAWEQAKDELVDDIGKKEIDYFTGQFDIDYTHYDNLTEEQKKACPKSGKLGYVRKVELSEGDDEKSGTMTFVNTVGEHSQTYDFSYPKQIVFNMDQDNEYYDGSWDIYYYGAENQHGQFVFPKTLNISEDGVFSYVDSAGTINEQKEKIVFIDDVFVDNAHQLWIAYTDNTKMENQGIETGTPLDKNGVPLENGKTYINYGQTIGTLGIMSGPMPEDATAKSTIENIVSWFNDNCTNGVVDGKVSGKLHVVTTEPLDGSDPISYFVAWNPDAGTWYEVSEIAGAPVGVPVQIGGTLTTGGQENWTYADSEEVLADGAIRFVQLEEDEQPLITAFPWM